MTIEILDPGFLTTVQDGGRRGYERFGVPVSGAMDWFALQAANRLAGNPAGAAGLEIGLSGCILRAHSDCLIAVAGAGFDLLVQGRLLPAWTAVVLRRGWVAQLVQRPGGCWAVLAVSGGIRIPAVMGSCATYLRGKLGGVQGRALQRGDVLEIGEPPDSFLSLAGRSLARPFRPDYGNTPLVEVLAGPQFERFTAQAVETFFNHEYEVAPDSDRMGYRLQGPPLQQVNGADILSDGLVMGAIQVPASGQPLVMMADRPATGGYTKIACVISADLPLLAQCPPGLGRVRFRLTTVEAAQARLREMQNWLQTGLQALEEAPLLGWSGAGL